VPMSGNHDLRVRREPLLDRRGRRPRRWRAPASRRSPGA
jgi:hypothetical protein